MGYDDSCLAAIRHVKSIIRVVKPRPNIRSQSVLFRIKTVDYRHCYTDAFKVPHARKTCLCFCFCGESSTTVLTGLMLTLRVYTGLIKDLKFSLSNWLLNSQLQESLMGSCQGMDLGSFFFLKEIHCSFFCMALCL